MRDFWRWRFGVGFLAAALVGGPTSAFADRCTLQRIASLTAQRSPWGEYIVPVSLNGKDFKFAVDTGGVDSILSGDSADALSLPRKELSDLWYSASGKVIRETVRISKFQLGPMVGNDIYFLVSPSGFADHHRDASINGALGANFLVAYDLELDPAHNVVNLYSRDHCPGKVVYWATSWTEIPIKVLDKHIAVTIQLDGKPIQALVDTGASVTTLNLRAAGRTFDLHPGDQGVDAAGTVTMVDGVKLPAYTHQFGSLELAGLKVANPKITLTATQGPPQDDLKLAAIDHETMYKSDLLLGMDVLRNLHLYVSYNEDKIYATGANAQ